MKEGTGLGRTRTMGDFVGGVRMANAGPLPAGRRAEEMTARHQAWAAGQPMVTRCSECDWTFEGTAAEGADAHRQHRLEIHPDLKERRQQQERERARRAQEKGARRAAEYAQREALDRPDVGDSDDDGGLF